MFKKLVTLTRFNWTRSRNHFLRCITIAYMKTIKIHIQGFIWFPLKKKKMQDSFRYWAFWKPEIWLKWILMETQKIDSSFYSRFFRCLCKDLTCWQNILHCLLCSLLVAGSFILLGNESLGLNTDLVCCFAMRYR